jgi:hypothetical protein
LVVRTHAGRAHLFNGEFRCFSAHEEQQRDAARCRRARHQRSAGMKPLALFIPLVLAACCQDGHHTNARVEAIWNKCEARAARIDHPYLRYSAHWSCLQEHALTVRSDNACAALLGSGIVWPASCWQEIVEHLRQ